MRDAGSANGIYVNGRRVERARLQPGDALRVGDTVLTLLAEIGETVVMAPDDFDLRTVVGAPRPPAPDLALRPPVEPPPRPTAPGGAVPPVLPRRRAAAAAVPAAPSRPPSASWPACGRSSSRPPWRPPSTPPSASGAARWPGGSVRSRASSWPASGGDGARPARARALGPPPPDRDRRGRPRPVPVHPRLGHGAPLHDAARGEGRASRRRRPRAPPGRATAPPTPRFALSLVGMLALGAAPHRDRRAPPRRRGGPERAVARR